MTSWEGKTKQVDLNIKIANMRRWVNKELIGGHMRFQGYSDHGMKDKFISFIINYTSANGFERSDLYFDGWKLRDFDNQ